MAEIVRCEFCRFWQAVDWMQDAGNCRRRAPVCRQVLKEELTDGTYNRAVWPLTEKKDWCGEVEDI